MQELPAREFQTGDHTIEGVEPETLLVKGELLRSAAGSILGVLTRGLLASRPRTHVLADDAPVTSESAGVESAARSLATFPGHSISPAVSLIGFRADPDRLIPS